MRNLYSGFLLGSLLIFSSLFYGLALTNSDKKFKHNSSVLDGTWELVDVRQFDANGNLLSSAADIPVPPAIKIVANRHFSRVNTGADGRVVSATAGLLELSADLYHEYYGFTKQVESMAYQWQLVDGRLTQRRTEQNRVIEEIWQLVE